MRALVVLFLVGILGAIAFLHEADGSAPHPDDPRAATGESGIVMLAADWCGYCRRQQAEFERAQVRYRRVDVDTPEGERAMRALGAKGVPVTVVGQQVIRGFDTAALNTSLSPLGYRVFAR